MKYIKIAVALSFVLSIFSVPHFRLALADNGGTWAEETILAYIKANGLDIRPGTDEYNNLLKGITLGQVPDLTKPPTDFVKNDAEAYYIERYAIDHYQLPGEWRLVEQTEDPGFEATPIAQENPSNVSNLSQTGFLNAIAYAYEWSINGGYDRNPAYPDFGDDDCTNFISQAMHEGGFSQIGDGDGCKYENTTAEWYVEYNPSPSWICLGENRDWEWSTSWSVPYDFRYYLVDNNFAIYRGYTTSATVAKSYLSPGDVVQLQRLNNGSWETYHSMLVTNENNSDLYVTYHSGLNNLDVVNQALSQISTTNKRFVLLEIQYPDFTFADVPPYHWAWEDVERLYSSGITSGCQTNPRKYCPESSVTRAQMAVFLERGIHGSSFTPPNVPPSFYDTVGHWAEDWIEALYSDGITTGCGGGNYCPEDPATHAQMAVFLLRSKHGRYYVPPAATGTIFSDVPTSHWAANWIERAWAEGIFDTDELESDGCLAGYFCPETPVTRAIMAGLLVRTFQLP